MMDTKTSIIATIICVTYLPAFLAVVILGAGLFQQREMTYYDVVYDLDEGTGLVVTSVEGRRLTIDADKIVSLPSDCDSGNILYVGEYKTLFFTKTVYKAERFVIVIPTEER